MKKITALAMVAIFSFMFTPFSGALSTEEVQSQFKALQEQIRIQQTQMQAQQEQYQKQIAVLQDQLDDIKRYVAIKTDEYKEDSVRISQLEEKTNAWHERILRDGTFSAQDALGLDEESLLNIGGEMKMRHRQNLEKRAYADHPGFQFYELELFIDSVLNDYSAIYAEYNLMHSNHPDPEDVWIDFHISPEMSAFGSGTGLKIGNFHYPFGWDNDDNEGYVYGGRTTVNVPLVRSERIDGWALRERQIGLAGNYNFDIGEANITVTGGMFNGNGSWLNYGGSDNDQRKDFATRVEIKLADIVFGTSYVFAPRTVSGITANANNTQHMRDIHRYGIHFKYPDVPFPGQDMSLGGSKWMIWGEYVGGVNKSSDIIAASARTAKPQGGYLEFDYSLIDDKLLGFVRGDLYDPDAGVQNDTLFGFTPGIKWNFLGSSFLIAEYEFYSGDTDAASGVTKDDRITLEVSTMF